MEAQAETSSPPQTGGQPAAATPHPPRGRLLIQGATFGMLLGFALDQFLFPPFAVDLVLASIVACALLWLSARARRLLWLAGAATLPLYVVIGYTPLMRPLLRGLERRDALRPAAAVVVLGASTNRDGTPASPSQERFIEGYSVLRQGYAPRLVLTRPADSDVAWHPFVVQQMRRLGIECPTDVVGPVRNTNDEAIAVATLAHQRGWDTIILVTHAWHMKRAAAVFEKQGLHVICSPCIDGRYDLNTLEHARDRLGAFRYWLRETVAYRVYQWRGRI